jgi:hypothetical protein
MGTGPDDPERGRDAAPPIAADAADFGRNTSEALMLIAALLTAGPAALNLCRSHEKSDAHRVMKSRGAGGGVQAADSQAPFARNTGTGITSIMGSRETERLRVQNSSASTIRDARA